MGGVLEGTQQQDGKWRRDVDNRLDKVEEMLEKSDGRMTALGGELLHVRGEIQVARSSLATQIEDGNKATVLARLALTEQIDENTRVTKENKEATAAIEKSTSEFVTWVKNVTGFKNVVKAVASALVQVSIVIVAAGVLWYVVTKGSLPQPKSGQAVEETRKG